MTDNQLDDIFKKRLESYESPVPADMWHRISSKKRKKKPVFWWFASTFVLIALSTCFLLIINTTNDIGRSNSKNSVQKEKDFDNTARLPGNLKKRGEKQLTGIKSNSRNNSSFKKTAGTFIIDSRSALTTSTYLLNSNPDKTDPVPDVEIISHPGKDSMHTKTIISGDTAQKNNTQEQDQLSTEENKEQKDEWFIEVFMSPAVPFNRIKSGDLAYERSLKKSLSTRISFGVGADIGYLINKSLSLKTGLYFTQVNEQYSFPDSVLIRTSVIKNRYSFVGVPLLLTINKEFYSGLRASLTTGVVVNISSLYKGVIPSPFGGTLNIKKDDIYDSNIRADLYMGLSLSKHLNNNNDLFAEPFLRCQLKNITTDFQSFDHKINIVGLSVGLRHYLFKDKAR
jgi:hypothetical protein